MPEISIIVVTYNSSWEKLKITINSILFQSGINYEIIFADDGSQIKWNEKIIQYIPDNYVYCFADSKTNVGTVSNIFNGIRLAKGDYIKVISPGDCFNGKFALKEWIDFMKKSDADLSFCDAIYYKSVNNIFKVLKTKASPRNVYLYHIKNNSSKIFIDYLLANDFILGAAVLLKRNVMLQYLEEINGKVKFAEDYMIRLMIYDNKKIYHINSAFIWYEYGDGISTNKNSEWALLLHKDFNAVNDIIKLRDNCTDKIHKNYKNLLINRKYRWLPYKVKKLILFPAMLLYRIQMRFFFKKTPVVSIDVLNQIFNY